MSSASTGRYQSRLLNFLLDKSQQFSDRMGKAMRQVKTATVWGIQLLIYPVYAMVQTGRLAGQQIQQVANPTLQPLPKPRQTSQDGVPVAEDRAQTFRGSLSNVPLPALSDRADRGFLVRAFHKLIHWMETGTIAVKVNLFKESRFTEQSLPSTLTPCDRNTPEGQNRFTSVSVSEAPHTEGSSWLQTIDRTVAQLESGQFTQWPELANDMVEETRSLWEPVKNWYMWQGDDVLDLDDDDLTRDLWAEPSIPNQTIPNQTKVTVPKSPSASVRQLPGKVLPHLIEKSEAAIHTAIAKWFGNVSALVHPETVNKSLVQTPSDHPSTSTSTSIATSVNKTLDLNPQQAFSAMAAEELTAVGEFNHQLLSQNWDALRTNAANLKQPLAMSPTVKSSDSLATVTTATSQRFQNVSETVGTMVEEIQIAKPINSNHLIPQNTIASSTITQTTSVATAMGEPETGRDYIEANVVSTGYIKHPLEMVLESIDWVMLRVETFATHAIEWLSTVKNRLFD